MKPGTLKTGLPAGFLLLSALVWLYILLRAWFMQLSIDEAATFYMYVQPGRFIPPYSTVDANNHILNSFLSWICYSLFGSHPFVLRIPNVLAALVYFYFILKIALLFRYAWSKWAFVILSLGTHFLVEFFGYSRGYGLSMAFFMASVYYTSELHRSFRLSCLLKVSFAIILAILSNFNLIFSTLALLTLIFAFTFRKRQFISFKSRVIILLALLLVVLPVFAYVIYVSFQIRGHSGFYYGSGDGFMAVTLTSLSGTMAGKASLIFLWYALILLLAITAALFMRWFRTGGLPATSSALFMAAFLMVLSSWLGSLLLHEIFQVNFQEDRAAMHYIPLFFILLISGLDSILSARRSWLWSVLLPLLIIPAFSVSKVSLQTSVYGPRQMVPDEYFTYISEQAAGSEYPPIVSAWQTRKQPWAFLNYREGGRLNPLQSSGFPNPDADFIILDPASDSLPDGFSIIMRNTASRTVLCKRDNPLSFGDSLISILDSVANTSNSFFNIHRFQIPGDTIKTAFVTMEYRVSSPSAPLEAVFVFEAFDSNRRSLVYEAIDLDQLKPEWTGEDDLFKHSMLIGGIPEEAESLLLYFWNKNAVPVTIRDGKAQIFWQ